MIRLLIKNWWLLFLRGVLAIAFAIFIYVFPAISAGALSARVRFCRPGCDICIVRLATGAPHHGGRGARSGAKATLHGLCWLMASA